MSTNKENEENYFANTRLDLVSLLSQKKKGLKVLEVGMGRGNTLVYLKESGLASQVVGIDIQNWSEHEIPAQIDEFISGNIEQLSLSNFTKSFDLIIFADVLEHLVSPEVVLEKVSACLKDDGEILISIPNIRHKKAFFKIFIKGDFSYEDSGLFDRTHLRFYCKKNIEDLIEDTDLKIDKMISSLKTYKGFSVSKFINLMTLGFFEEFLTVQYLVKASKRLHD